jgi:hypothetical protein
MATGMSEDNREHNMRRRGFPKWVLWGGAAVAVLLLYVLSVGPVHWLARGHGRSVREAVNAFYTPLGLTADRFPALRRAFEWYANLL